MRSGSSKTFDKHIPCFSKKLGKYTLNNISDLRIIFKEVLIRDPY